MDDVALTFFGFGVMVAFAVVIVMLRQIHILVNSRLDAALDKIDRLEVALTAARREPDSG